MFTSDHNISFVTAVLPSSAAPKTLIALTEDEHVNALVSKARGSLLREHWWKTWVPPISPAKTLVRLLVPEQDLDRVINLIAEHGNLHRQASGAVFSLSASSVHVGSKCELLTPQHERPDNLSRYQLQTNLQAIFCIVSHADSERITKAAIRAGAHGPIVQYTEGHGLRDRLGWLRITKDSEKEVLMILADHGKVDAIFAAMSKAGEFHLPGRGFLYRMPVDKGMFNLPSRSSNNQFDANMQQVINAIDHLTGHTHWRDQSVFQADVDFTGRVRSDDLESADDHTEHCCFTIVVDRDNAHGMMDLLLSAGAPGLNLSYTKLLAEDPSEHHVAHAQVNQEYAVMRCVVNHHLASKISTAIECDAEKQGLDNMCAMTHPVTAVITYVPGNIDHRNHLLREIAKPSSQAAVRA